MTVHATPPHGEATTPCCDTTPFELPTTDRMMSYRCRCIWDCSHAWCGCPAHTGVVCVCGVRPRDCPVHVSPSKEETDG